MGVMGDAVLLSGNNVTLTFLFQEGAGALWVREAGQGLGWLTKKSDLYTQ